MKPQTENKIKTPLPGTSSVNGTTFRGTFSEWLSHTNDSLQPPESFSEWVALTGDSINEENEN